MHALRRDEVLRVSANHGAVPLAAKMASAEFYLKGSSWNRVGDFARFHSAGSMHVSTLSRRYSSSRKP
jgi:hypothetical protein